MVLVNPHIHTNRGETVRRVSSRRTCHQTADIRQGMASVENSFYKYAQDSMFIMFRGHREALQNLPSPKKISQE